MWYTIVSTCAQDDQILLGFQSGSLVAGTAAAPAASAMQRMDSTFKAGGPSCPSFLTDSGGSGIGVASSDSALVCYKQLKWLIDIPAVPHALNKST